MKFSIVVPIYNIAKYLPQCIESVLNQSFVDYELLLVNDGSKDNSLEICESYAKNDERIKVIDKKNGGVSSARNSGLDQALGDYIVFLDGDDFFVEECLLKLDHYSNNRPELDIIACHMDTLIDEVLETNYRLYPEVLRTIGNHDRLAYLVEHKLLKWNVFSNLYKRSFIENHHLRFIEDFVGAEDLDYVFQVYYHNPLIDYCDISICTYRVIREGSITTNFKSHILMKQLQIFKKWFDIYHDDKEVSEGTRHTLCQFFSSLIVMKASNTYLVNEAYKERVITFLEENRYIMNYPTSFKNKIINKAYDVLGFVNGSKLLHIYHQLFSKKTLI